MRLIVMSESVRKNVPDLPRALDLVGMEVDRGGRHGGMPQVIPHGRQLDAARERMGRMGVPHPVRRRALQLVRCGRAHAFQSLCGVEEEAAHDRPQVRYADPGPIFCQAGHQRGLGIPARPRHWQSSLRQILIERASGQ